MLQTEVLQTAGKNNGADPFGKNAAASMVYTKMEKLMTATFLVTNHVPKNENLRGRVRDIASELLTDTIKLREGFASSGTDALSGIIAQVRLLLSLLDALFASSLISEMNIRILKEAYLDFVNSLEGMRGVGAAEGVELTKDHFAAQVSLQHKKEKAASPTPPSQSAPVDHQAKSTPERAPVVAPLKKVLTSSIVSTQSPRAATIIDFIRKRGEASVPDVAQVIQGCSSKTLQRDLASLVQQGILTKTGNKRWTKYRLA